ncbi:hypothetical protein B0H19DRAFT_1067019 [Mycena capillaripes]|nr:hypothetical protein B0H19DRAFT_1067019 [Mycena capillaripes]
MSPLKAMARGHQLDFKGTALERRFLSATVTILPISTAAALVTSLLVVPPLPTASSRQAAIYESNERTVLGELSAAPSSSTAPTEFDLHSVRVSSGQQHDADAAVALNWMDLRGDTFQEGESCFLLPWFFICSALLRFFLPAAALRFAVCAHADTGDYYGLTRTPLPRRTIRFSVPGPPVTAGHYSALPHPPPIPSSFSCLFFCLSRFAISTICQRCQLSLSAWLATFPSEALSSLAEQQFRGVALFRFQADFLRSLAPYLYVIRVLSRFTAFSYVLFLLMRTLLPRLVPN